MHPTIIRLRDVINRTALSRSSIYAYIQKGDFPAPVSLGARASGWVEEEVNDWIQSKIEQRGA